MNRRHAFAAAVLGTAAAFLATACGPSDSGSSAPASSTQASTTAGSAAPSSQASTPGSPAGSKNSRAVASTAPPVVVPAGTPKKASPVRTQTLPDGSKAEVYKLGDQHYLAKVVNSGQLFVTLETKGHDAGIDANDMFIVLTLDGHVHAWMGGGHQGPGTFKLAGGWTAKVTKIGELRYRAQILGNQGEVDATLETNQHDVGLDANAVYIVLSNGGVISAHE